MNAIPKMTCMPRGDGTCDDVQWTEETDIVVMSGWSESGERFVALLYEGFDGRPRSATALSPNDARELGRMLLGAADAAEELRAEG